MDGGWRGGGGERELPRSQGASKPCIAGEISPAPRPSRNDSVAFVSQTAKQWSRKRQIGKLRNQDCQLACYSRSCLVTRPRARGCTWRFYEAGPTWTVYAGRRRQAFGLMGVRIKASLKSAASSSWLVWRVKDMDVCAVLRVNVSIRGHLSQDSNHCPFSVSRQNTSPFLASQCLTSRHTGVFRQTVVLPAVTSVSMQWHTDKNKC